MSALAIFTTTTFGQGRLVTLSRFTTPTLIEHALSGFGMGPPTAVTPLPPHGLALFRPNLVAMAGARYLFWTAAVASSIDDIYEVIAVFDRRTRSIGVIPGQRFTSGTVQLVADPLRPRIFVHKWAVFGGSAGLIGVVDETLTYRSVLVAGWIGTAFAYAPQANRLFVTRYHPFQDPLLEVVVLDGDTAQEVGAFPVPAEDNLRENQLTVTADGQRVFYYKQVFFDQDQVSQIHLFDGMGVPLATSARVDLAGYNRFVVDEIRGILLVPERIPVTAFSSTRRLIALDAATLAPLGAANGGAYGLVQTFQPLYGKGPVGAYVAWTPEGDTTPVPCRPFIDVFDTAGGLASRLDIAQQSGFIPSTFVVCTAITAVLSAPAAPSTHAANVQANH
ncbi:MAG: hypothetical protein ACRD96_22470, partial [Bryobacteraceae bacterium]